MSRIVTIFLLLIIGACQAWAHVIISGRVTDNAGEPLPALITILSGKTVSGFGIANEDGRYSISFSPSTDKVTVRAALLGFEAKEGVAEPPSKNKQKPQLSQAEAFRCP